MSDTERNKEVVRRWVEEVWSSGRAELMDELLDEHLVDHNPIPGVPAGREGNKAILGMFHSAFDVKMKLDLLLADGDYVIDRWTADMTHKGEFMGIPATGKQVRITGIDVSRLENGKVVETWHQEDNMGLMQQLGAMQAPS
jgi:predicted ester cyclase